MSPSGAEYIRQIKSQIDEVDPVRGPRRCTDNGVAIVDVRENERVRRRPPARAPSTSRAGYLESRIEGAVPDRAQRVILYCASGNRSALAANTLRDELGYEHVESMTGGYTLWKDRGYEVEVPRTLTRRAARALQPPHARPRDRPRGPAEAARRQGAPARRRRPRLADRALPRRGRRRHARASSTTTSSTSPTSSARSSTRPTASACRRSTPPRQRSRR